MKLAAKVVGLTGGLGCGKSTVRRMWESLGVPCTDADAVARDIHQNPHHAAVAEIARVFPQAMTADGRLNRGSLRSLFAIDATANAKLKKILAPHVIASMQQWTMEQAALYVVWESALLIEEKIAVDRLVVVDTNTHLQLARIVKRNPDWSAAQINSVLAMQLGRQDRLIFADDTICNDSSLSSLEEKAQALHANYLQRWT